MDHIVQRTVLGRIYSKYVAIEILSYSDYFRKVLMKMHGTSRRTR